MDGLPEPLDNLARDVCAFYESVLVHRGMERSPNKLLAGECTGTTLLFQSQAKRLAADVGVVHVRISPRQQEHKKKLREYRRNCAHILSRNGGPIVAVPLRHSWNTWNGLHVDLTARQFGYSAAPYYGGAQPFIADIRHEVLGADAAGAFAEWFVPECDEPEFEAWRNAGRDWSAIQRWDAKKQADVHERLRSLSRLARGMGI